MVPSLDVIRDLFRHMEWADASVWRALLRNDAARADASMHERLHHIHLVQHAFFTLWREERLDLPEASTFADLPALGRWARGYYRSLTPQLDLFEDVMLTRVLHIPWSARFMKPFGREAAGVTVGESMLQVASHSTNHRGQVNMRLREMGGDAPLVDYIAWLWLGRPDHVWPEEIAE